MDPFRSEAVGAVAEILYEKSFNLKTISQGGFGHFRETNLIILENRLERLFLNLNSFPIRLRG